MAIAAPADRRWIPFRAILGLAIGAAVGLAAAAIFWETGLIRGETVAAWQDEFVAAQTGPGLVLAMALALVIGASMVVLPCGSPSVFAVPSLLQRADTTSGRFRALVAFTAGGVLPLAIVGAALGLTGAGLWEALSDGHTRQIVAAIAYPLLGVIAIAYALSEFGLLHFQGLLTRVGGTGLPGGDMPGWSAFVSGATFGSGAGIACPMPTYYALLGWVTLAASPWYGAVVLAAYGLGRILPAVAIGILIAAGAGRREVSFRLATLHNQLQWTSGVVMATLGFFLITLFGGFLGFSLA